MCAALGLHVLSLERVAMGPIVLGHLPLGKFRHLAPSEVEALRNAAIKAGENAKDKPHATKTTPRRPSAAAKSAPEGRTDAKGRAGTPSKRKTDTKRVPSANKKPTGERRPKGAKS
jgi:23S rRNA pseudouridine2605 synthase